MVNATVAPGGGAGRTGLVCNTALEVGITDELVLESDDLVLDLVSREIVARQFAADRPETVTLGYVRRLTELRYGQVPAASVVADGDRTCILTGEVTESLEPLAVSPVSGKPGVVLLEDATVGLTYLANPYEVLAAGGSCS